MWKTKKALKKEIYELINKVEELTSLVNQLEKENFFVKDELSKFENEYPFELGQIVYDVQLRSSKGRFTKTKASREHSVINEVTVDNKNYFNLVERYKANDVFKSRELAEHHLDTVCTE